MSGFQRDTTYSHIKTYVLKKHGLKVSDLYLSGQTKVQVGGWRKL